MNTNRILVALDLSSAEDAVRLATRLKNVVGGFKVGLELLTGPGPGVVAALRRLELPIFVDAKLHDIPNTVRAGARQLGGWGARWVSIHTGGGRTMIEAAVEGLAGGASGHPAGILAVTVLTSLDAAGLAATGITGSPGRQVARLTRLAAQSGAEGVVCAPSELGDVAQVAPGLLRVTPGIRPEGVSKDDQTRIATPLEALRRGADYLVIGRPITRATDPYAAAERIAAELQSAVAAQEISRG
jgi:orotidine-5'-phosphate decarboxylase